MISLLADAFKYAAAEHGLETTTVANNGMTIQSPYESATARTMERLANESLSQRRPPTVTINQGTIVNVYVAKDVDFTNVLNPAGNPTNDHGRRSVPLALVSSDFLRYQYEVLGIAEYMTSPEVTEICINRPGELYLETRAVAAGGRAEPDVRAGPAVLHGSGEREQHRPAHHRCRSGGVAHVPTGQRAQFVIPPACDAGRCRSPSVCRPSTPSRSASITKMVSSTRS